MGRIIEDAPGAESFHPLVSIRNVGQYVKGKVTAMGQTVNGNPVVTLQLIDLDGSTQRSTRKGVYEEVDVNIGDLVQVVGSVKRLKEKLPQLTVGDVATITFTGLTKMPRGGQRREFKVEVD